MTASPPELLRSSRTMAFGTVASRGTGFVRTVVIAAAIGDRALGDAYNIANVLPNIIYELLLGGVLTSVVVPLLVAAVAADHGGDAPGEAYAQRLLTLVTLVLSGTVVLAIAAAPLAIGLYGHFGSDRQHDLAVEFARYFLPQILFYGIGATIGAILNTRGHFAAPMWAPVLNNLVVIATGVVFMIQEPPKTGSGLGLSTAEFHTLAVGTTAGIVVQTLALLPALRRTGFRLRPRLDLRLAELRTAGRLAGWVFIYVAANQAALVVVISLARAASNAAGPATAAGYSPYLYAFALFSLPHAVVAVSIITALLPRMSHHAVEGRLDRLRVDLSAGLRLAGTLIVPAAWALALLGPLIATMVFGHGRVGVSDARLIGFVLAGFALGLVPFSAFQLHLRAFFATGDTRTPALVNVAVNLVNIAADVALYAALPPRHRVIGLAVGYAASYAVGLGLLSRILARRLPEAGRQRVVQTYVRLGVAGGLAGGLALGAALLVVAAAGSGPGAAALGLAAGLPVGAAAYLAVATRLKVPEVRQVLALARGAAPGR